MTTQYGFIPHNLNIDAEPKFSKFPYKIMFMSFTEKNGIAVSGTSLYSPDLSTFVEKSNEMKMIYRNHYGLNSFLVIKYDKKMDKYEGEKFVGNKRITLTVGKTWKQFFIHLTILGLQKGEECEFNRIK